MISPLRILALGIPAEDVAAFFSITVEDLELMAEEAEMRRRSIPLPAGKTLMTRLLLRPEMDYWETRKADR